MNKNLMLYERSKNNLWTNRHIARNLLDAHLNLENDAASRNIKTIRKTVDWIDREMEPKSRLLDLGCGPGLYAEIFAAKGHFVTGVDVSRNSISYAKKAAKNKRLKISYMNSNYLDRRIRGTYDAAVCIYCDFGALIPDEQARFLGNAYSALSDDGILIFDVFADGLNSAMKESKTWAYYEKGGFWYQRAHFLLEETVHFPKERAWGRRSIVIGKNGRAIKEYVVWNNYFTPRGISDLLSNNGFRLEKIEIGLVDANSFASNDVMFVKARKL